MENEVAIFINIKNYEEIIEKLEKIKKLLNDISNIQIEIK